ncbi:GPO family capsid scaffolding protein [Ursidibacter sp. B-7004-1]
MATKSKWFVVATEGATTDGRNIHRSWIEQMAKNYDPENTFGARVNLEHIKTWFYRENEPHSKCYGDVLAVKAEEREDGKLQLLAQIDPTSELVALNKARQKIYTSIEVDPNFADTGEAYLVGLAVTDDPASLGTEMLSFAKQSKSNPFNHRKERPENVFSEAVETSLEFTDEKESFLAKIKAMFSQQRTDNAEQFKEHQKTIELLAQEITAHSVQLEAKNAEITKLTADLTALQNQVELIANRPEANFTPRPEITGAVKDENGRFF